MLIVDPCIKSSETGVHEKALDIGWDDTSVNGFKSTTVKASNWGELRKKIRQEREVNEILIVEADKEDLCRRTAEMPETDLLIANNSVDEETVKKASENNVAICFNFNDLLDSSRKSKTATMSEWRRLISLSEKYGTDYAVTSGAEDKYELRPPKGLKALIESLNGDGRKAIQQTGKILEKNRKVIK